MENQVSEFFPVSDESYTNCVVVSEKHSYVTIGQKVKDFWQCSCFDEKISNRLQIGNVQLPLKNDVTSLF